MKSFIIQILILFLFVSACKTTEKPVTNNIDQLPNPTVGNLSDIKIINDTVEGLSGLFDIKYIDFNTGELLFTHKNYNSPNLHLNFVEIYNTSPTVLQHLPPNTHYIISTKP